MTVKGTKRTKKFWAVVCAVIVASLMCASFSFAYFTDYDRASGKTGLSLGWETNIKEEMDGNNKSITIENIGETDTIIRVRVFAGDFVTVEDRGLEKYWKQEGDWWYYDRILAPGQETTELYAEVKAADAGADDFEVTVVHESARTVYENNKTLKTPEDWAYVPEL